MQELEGDWALITGATSGIGYEMAKMLAAEGRSLVLVSRDEERLCQVARELNEVSDIIIMPVDLSVTGSAVTLYNECDRLGLKVNMLINNAGFGKFGESFSMRSYDVESMLTLNVTTLTSLSNLFGKRMKERKSGYILNVASTAGYLSLPYFSAYASSKAYVRYFSSALREELKDHNVSVTCLLPGATATRFFNVAFENSHLPLLKRLRMMSPQQVAKLGLKGMYRRKKEVVPGVWNKIVSRVAGFIPPSLISKVIRKKIIYKAA